MVYPAVRHSEPPNDDLPEEIKPDYNEASTVLPLSPRAAAALLRLCIQKLCQFVLKHDRTGNLNLDIGKLVERGLDKRIQRAWMWCALLVMKQFTLACWTSETT